MPTIFDVKESAVVREQVLAQVMEGFPVNILVEGGAIAVPVTLPDGKQGFAKITVTVPKGERGGAGWEPQEDADAFQAHLAEQAEKKAKAKAAKDAKIARDAKVRADKAQAQAQG